MIDPYQQFAYTSGKNASDIALVIDAMDLLHTGRFDGFVRFPRTATSHGLHPVSANRGPTSTASACKRRPRVSDRRAADLSILKICCPTPRLQRSKKGDLARLEPPRAAIPILNKAIAQLETEDGWVGLGRGRSTLSEHRLRLRHAYLRLSETQRSGPQDRSVRHGAAEGRGHADQGKDNSAIKNRFEAGMTASQVCDASACGAALSSSISVGSIR